jgi:energy-coupling factor transporter ATP-binding protein EcfA2
MYLRSLKIEGVRSIDQLELKFDAGDEPGWHVIVGPNGSGKSSIVRAIALSMLSERDVEASNENFDPWLRAGSTTGGISASVEFSWGEENQTTTAELEWKLERVGQSTEARAIAPKEKKLPWHSSKNFSASFGPFRRITGGDNEYESHFSKRPRLGAHLTALSEAVALFEAARWLQDLHIDELDVVGEVKDALTRHADSDAFRAQIFAAAAHKRSVSLKAIQQDFERVTGTVTARRQRPGSLIWVNAIDFEIFEEDNQLKIDLNFSLEHMSRKIIAFLNSSGFLFDRVKIADIKYDRIVVSDQNNFELSLNELSDGYRTVISLGLELLRLMHAICGPKTLLEHFNEKTGAIDLPGVVAIDEIEAHLHPYWQTQIGPWLRKCFPKMQFIVTTHSPIVCRAVAQGEELQGSLWLLGAAGSGKKLKRISGEELKRVVYGDIVEALGTDVFGRQIEQSADSAEMLDRLATLNLKAATQKLSGDEKAELERLRATFPARSPILAE